jgi:hypothetical protein
MHLTESATTTLYFEPFDFSSNAPIPSMARQWYPFSHFQTTEPGTAPTFSGELRWQT